MAQQCVHELESNVEKYHDTAMILRCTQIMVLHMIPIGLVAQALLHDSSSGRYEWHGCIHEQPLYKYQHGGMKTEADMLCKQDNPSF